MKVSILAAAALVGAMLSLSSSGQSAPAASAIAAPTGTIKPGLWETTTVIENTASNSRRSVVSRGCVVAADVSNLARIVPVQREFGMQCENRDVKKEGTSVTWTISCKSADATQNGKGKMSLFGDSYLGTADVELRKPGAKPSKLSQSFSGKWVQACS
jgi:hypothetical protein